MDIARDVYICNFGIYFIDLYIVNYSIIYLFGFQVYICISIYIFFLTKSRIRSDGCRSQMGEKAILKITLLDRSAEYNRFFGSTISINFTGGSD